MYQHNHILPPRFSRQRNIFLLAFLLLFMVHPGTILDALVSGDVVWQENRKHPEPAGEYAFIPQARAEKPNSAHQPSPPPSSAQKPASAASTTGRTAATAKHVPFVLRTIPVLHGGNEIRGKLNTVPIPPVNDDNAPSAPHKDPAPAPSSSMPPESAPQDKKDAASNTPSSLQGASGISRNAEKAHAPDTRNGKPEKKHDTASVRDDKTERTQNAPAARDSKTDKKRDTPDGNPDAGKDKKMTPASPQASGDTPSPKGETQILQAQTHLECKNGRVLFRISGNPALKGTSFMLQQPSRIVLDLEGCWNMRLTQPHEKSLLAGIRHNIKPEGTTRLVFDLARTPQSWKKTQVSTSTIELHIQ